MFCFLSGYAIIASDRILVTAWVGGTYGWKETTKKTEKTELEKYL